MVTNMKEKKELNWEERRDSGGRFVKGNIPWKTGKHINSQDNLISLCHSCHAQTGFNRDSWINYFNSVLNSAREVKQ